MRHKLLQRQIRKHLKSLESIPVEQNQELQKFLSAVSDSYENFERNHRFLERSMELSSQELVEANRDLRIGSDEIQALYRILTVMQEPHTIVASCEAVLPEIQKFSDFPIVVIELFNEEKTILEMVAQVGIPKEVVEKSGEDIWQKWPILKSFSTPIDSQSGIIGLLTLADSHRRRPPERLSHWLTVVASQIGTVIEKKRLDEIVQLQKAKIISASKMSELGKMAGCVAHEINTPLATISLMTEKLLNILKEASVDLEEVSQCADVIGLTTVRIAKTVSGLRSFSRDGSSDEMEPAGLLGIVNDTLSLCHESFKRRGVELKLDIPDSLKICCRPTEISQVILNLLNNSQDAIEGQESKWVSLSVQEEDRNILLRITDSGTGIPQEVRNNLFEPFFTTKGIGKGTGLGLSISVRIIKSHGGDIEYDDKAANTSFIIRLPRFLGCSSKRAA